MAAAAAKSLQSCVTLCDPIDSSPPGSAIPGILQARTLEWVAISFSIAWKWKVKVKSLFLSFLNCTCYLLIYQIRSVAQSCPTLCDPIDSSPSGSAIPGILQARTLKWVATSFSIAWKWKVKVKSLSCILLVATPWTEAYQAPPSMGFSRQEYWSGLPLPSPPLRSTVPKFLQCSRWRQWWGCSIEMCFLRDRTFAS